MPATRKSAQPADVEDLGALVVARQLTPAPKRLFGLDFAVRRDLTPEEYVEYWHTVSKGQDAASLAMLLTEPALAEQLNAQLDVLPREHMNVILARIMRTAGVLTRTPADEDQDAAEGVDEQGGRSASS
ncbi:hypothetical protein GCM10010428_49690 [Actinosynnema pretiosum subsp. pretiosum]|uniref:Uncharacterized protein n=2 Tax=Pseudonocardiaceae TaxID=2070 RepID=A0A290ZAY5_9PSEU|nr:hypothetical protein CNX65_25075 [Actinosynnema pretiosum]